MFLLKDAKCRHRDVSVVEEVLRLLRAVKRLEFGGMNIIVVNDGADPRGRLRAALGIRGALKEEV